MWWPFSSNKEHANKEAVFKFDYSAVKVDMHSHILPKLDDGSDGVTTSINLIKDLIDLGFSKLIATPHVMSEFYPNSTDQILSNHAQLKKELINAEIRIELDIAAEYYVDDHFLKLVSNKDVLTFGDKLVLIEFSYVNPPQNLFDVIFHIESNGYKPVLAHPERYAYWNNKFDVFQELKRRGVLFQINSNSFGGYYGISAQKTAINFSEKLFVDFLGTDAHNHKHAAALKVAIQNKHLQELIRAKIILNDTL